MEAFALEGEQTRQAGRAGHGVGGDARETLVVRAEDIGAAARDADDGVEHLLVECVPGMRRLVQHSGPARASAGEEHLHGLAGGLVFVGDSESVEDAAEGFLGIGFGIRQDDDGGFHGRKGRREGSSKQGRKERSKEGRKRQK